ncbi:MFS transporter [Arthrobacter sp. SDTb3-6]|uniref:MFS transporter n=1 Tax=Arthrobacter sp. SDTb3-6 TaxID=2713571 RepID=UPI00159EABBF|nr:MFS transporter [Arthrobacter sp. SDTb3-6]NVN00751.1 MHS family MFS transporter [Arthrobacter sp. SDTb3-6]
MARRAAISAFAGSTIEYFDFVIFATASALVFNKVFFAGLGGHAALLASLATFGVAYIARPLGAVVLGGLGDWIGRRAVLTTTLVIMGGATFVVGLLPGYDVLGAAAPIALVAMRVLQGLSAGAEQAGSNTLTSEHAPKEKRGLYTSWTMQGVVAGTLLAGASFMPITAAGEGFLLGGGWRIPFLLAGPLTLVAFWIRSRVDEPEVFTDARVDAPVVKTIPVLDIFRYHWANLIRVIFCSLFALSGSIIGVFALAYGTKTAGVDATTLILISTITGVVGLVVQPFMAVLSDKIGRKPVFISSVLLIAVGFFAIFAALGTGNVALIFVAFLGVQLVAVAGNVVQASFYTEMFPTKVRYTGVAFGTQLGLVLVGFAPAIGAAIQQPGRDGWVPVAIFGAAGMVLAAISAATAKETRGMDFAPAVEEGAVPSKELVD